MVIWILRKISLWEFWKCFGLRHLVFCCSFILVTFQWLGQNTRQAQIRGEEVYFGLLLQHIDRLLQGRHRMTEGYNRGKVTQIMGARKQRQRERRGAEPRIPLFRSPAKPHIQPGPTPQQSTQWINPPMSVPLPWPNHLSKSRLWTYEAFGA